MNLIEVLLNRVVIIERNITIILEHVKQTGDISKIRTVSEYNNIKRYYGSVLDILRELEDITRKYIDDHTPKPQPPPPQEEPGLHNNDKLEVWTGEEWVPARRRIIPHGTLFRFSEFAIGIASSNDLRPGEVRINGTPEWVSVGYNWNGYGNPTGIVFQTVKNYVDEDRPWSGLFPSDLSENLTITNPKHVFTKTYDEYKEEGENDQLLYQRKDLEPIGNWMRYWRTMQRYVGNVDSISPVPMMYYPNENLLIYRGLMPMVDIYPTYDGLSKWVSASSIRSENVIALVGTIYNVDAYPEKNRLDDSKLFTDYQYHNADSIEKREILDSLNIEWSDTIAKSGDLVGEVTADIVTKNFFFGRSFKVHEANFYEDKKGHDILEGNKIVNKPHYDASYKKMGISTNFIFNQVVAANKYKVAGELYWRLPQKKGTDDLLTGYIWSSDEGSSIGPVLSPKAFIQLIPFRDPESLVQLILSGIRDSPDGYCVQNQIQEEILGKRHLYRSRCEKDVKRDVETIRMWKDHVGSGGTDLMDSFTKKMCSRLEINLIIIDTFEDPIYVVKTGDHYMDVYITIFNKHAMSATKVKTPEVKKIVVGLPSMDDNNHIYFLKYEDNSGKHTKPVKVLCDDGTMYMDPKYHEEVMGASKMLLGLGYDESMLIHESPSSQFMSVIMRSPDTTVSRLQKRYLGPELFRWAKDFYTQNTPEFNAWESKPFHRFGGTGVPFTEIDIACSFGGVFYGGIGNEYCKKFGFPGTNFMYSEVVPYDLDIPAMVIVKRYVFNPKKYHNYYSTIFGKSKAIPLPIIRFMLNNGILTEIEDYGMYFAERTDIDFEYNSMINNPLTKPLIRKSIGMFGAHEAIATRKFKNSDEFRYHLQKNMENQSIKWGNEEELILSVCTDSDLDNYCQIRCFIIAYAQIQLCEMINRVVNMGIGEKIRKIMTDAIYVVEPVAEQILKANADIAGDFWGGWRIKRVHKLLYSNQSHIPYVTSSTNEDPKITQESMIGNMTYVRKEITIDTAHYNKFTYYYGPGGSGKTYSAVKVFRDVSADKNIVILTPDNRLAISHSEVYDGIRCSTYHKYFRVDSEGWEFNEDSCTDNFIHKYIIWDEICMVPVVELKKILSYLSKKSCVVIMCGDPGQLPPIGGESPHEYLLKKCKYSLVEKKIDHRSQCFKLRDFKAAMHGLDNFAQLGMLRELRVVDNDGLVGEWNAKCRVLSGIHSAGVKVANMIKEKYPTSLVRYVYDPKDGKKQNIELTCPDGRVRLVVRGSTCYAVRNVYTDWVESIYQTIHSVQGVTISDKTYILLNGINSLSKGFENIIYTAISRVVRFDDLVLVANPGEKYYEMIMLKVVATEKSDYDILKSISEKYCERIMKCGKSFDDRDHKRFIISEPEERYTRITGNNLSDLPQNPGNWIFRNEKHSEFYEVSDIAEFSEWYNDQDDKHFHEFILPDSEQKLRFDIECMDTLPQPMNEVIDIIVEKTDEVISTLYGNLRTKKDKKYVSSVEKDHVLILNSSGKVGNEYKHSYHIIFNQFAIPCAEMVKYIFTLIYAKLPKNISSIVDGQVYNSGQWFRIFGSRKVNSDRILKMDYSFGYGNDLKEKTSQATHNEKLLYTLTNTCVRFRDLYNCMTFPTHKFLPNILLNLTTMMKNDDIGEVSEGDKTIIERISKVFDLSPFTFRDRSGKIMSFNRIKPSKCHITDLIHEKDNTLYFVVMGTNVVNAKCRHCEGFKKISL